MKKIVLIISFMVFYIGVIIFILHSKRKYRYEIRQNSSLFYTDKVTKLDNGCINFIYKNNNITICGNYIIKENFGK